MIEATLDPDHRNEYAGIEAERARLVRLCAHLTEDADAADDLAQETLLEAWRHREDLRNPAARAAWLAGIARNVCRRWQRERGRVLARTALPPATDPAAPVPDPGACLADGFDLEVELERHELAELLDRALALLPPLMRTLLIEKYIHETPLAGIGARLGLSDNVIAVRLHRGKLALRQVLATDLRAEAAAYGLVPAEADPWQETRIWCPLCGARRLRGLFSVDQARFALRCPTCCPTPDDAVWQSEWTPLFQGIKGFKAAASRQMTHSHQYYGAGLRTGTVACMVCGRSTPLHLRLPESVSPALRMVSGLHVQCAHCGGTSWITRQGLARCHPAARAFWRRHPRLRSLPEHEIEVDGRPVIVNSFAALTSPARIDLLTCRDTFRLLRVQDTDDRR